MNKNRQYEYLFSSSNNAPLALVNNSLQGTMINPYNCSVTAEQTVRELQMNEYFADIQTTFYWQNQS